MRLLLTTTGYPGHVLPLVPFARACVEAGDEVCLAGPRSAGALVRGLGLDYCGFPDPPPERVGGIVAAAARLAPGEGHALMIREGFGRAATRAALGDIMLLVGAWQPDVVISESQELAGALAAERHGIAHVRVALGLASTDRQTRALMAPALDELRAELGLTGEASHAAAIFTPVPAALDDGDNAAAHRFREPRHAQAPPHDWWPGNGDDPLVYLTLRSVAASLGYFPRLYRAAIDAVADLPARVLVTVGRDADPDRLGPLPGNVRAERWVDQDAVAAHTSAVVCHGGHGSVIGALAHGCPLVVVPLFGDDQRHNARRVAQIGAGIRLEGAPRTMFEPPGADVLAELPSAIRRALDGAAQRAAAARVAAEIETLPPVAAAREVLAAIARA